VHEGSLPERNPKLIKTPQETLKSGASEQAQGEGTSTGEAQSLPVLN